MNYLDGKRAYLSGPIENDNTEHNWRTEPIKILTEKFGINVFDPFSDPKQQWLPTLKKAREEKNLEEIRKIAKSFVRKDLALLDRSDLSIAYLPHDIYTTGTVHEIINSNNAKKPTLLVTDCSDISYIPIWYYGFIETEFMFAGWESLYNYLHDVNNGKHKNNNRWAYIYGMI